MKVRAKIAGIGTCSPENAMTNFDFEKIVDTNDEWIRTRTGIVERRILAKDDKRQPSDLGAAAAKQALEAAGKTAEEIDCIICGTFTPDAVFPATACTIQEKIGAVNATAFDVMAACSGFLYALNIADSLIGTEKHRNVLVVGTEVISRVLNWEDRNTCILFGDGAGAAVVTVSDDDSAVLATATQSDGTQGEILKLPAWGDPRHIYMNGTEVFRQAVRRMADSIHKALNGAGLEVKDIDWLVPHQANTRIMRALARQIRLPVEKVIVNIEKFGNTSSASIPLALKDGIDSGKIKKGNIVVMSAIGGGLSWGAVAVRW